MTLPREGGRTAARPRGLGALFAPRTVAVIGASERPGSVGRVLMENLGSGRFDGAVYPVNPKHTAVLGRAAYPGISAVPSAVDLAVIATPAATVPDVVAQCAEAGVSAAVVISAGFKESGPAGAELERRVLAGARGAGMRILGPNCLGFSIPPAGINASFATTSARPGGIGFASQSGALCSAILDWSLARNIGFSAFISTGSMADVGWGDVIDYLGDDPATKAIAIYMESIGDARSFLSAAREVALTKPIVVIKAGRTAAARKAAASHTGSLTGSDDVVSAAFDRAGVLRVDTLEQLFEMIEVLARQPRPGGPKLTIVTNAGGPAILATDMLVGAGGELATPSAETLRELDRVLPPHWSHGNPIDVLGDADPERFAAAVDAAARDPDSDGLLMILTPQAMTDPTATADKIATRMAARPAGQGKPVLACWMGGEGVRAGNERLAAANVPTFDYPDAAARAFQYMWQYSANLRGLYETPLPAAARRDGGSQTSTAIVRAARDAGRTLLSELEAKQVLEASGIPCVPTRLAGDEADAVRVAEEFGYPVVLKLHSTVVTHKSDVGGVKLDLADASAVRSAFRAIQAAAAERAGGQAFAGVTVQPMVRASGYEVILGSSVDAQVGPVLLFGLGGQFVEVVKDRALGLPPLNTTLARRLMEKTKIYAAMKAGARGRRPADLAALDQLLVRFGDLVVEQPWVKEIDVNPLLVTEGGLVALDARMVLHEPGRDEATLPRPAIRPYPVQYVWEWTTTRGDELTIRPIRPDDESMLVAFHAGLSDQTVHNRYGGGFKLGRRVAHERLVRTCGADYDREIPLVAEHADPASGRREIVAVARLSKQHGRNEAEFAVVVSDRWQDRGIGTRLLDALMQVARAEGLERVTGLILAQNYAMQDVCRKAGFQLHQPPGDSDLVADIRLPAKTR